MLRFHLNKRHANHPRDRVRRKKQPFARNRNLTQRLLVAFPRVIAHAHFSVVTALGGRAFFQLDNHGLFFSLRESSGRAHYFWKQIHARDFVNFSSQKHSKMTQIESFRKLQSRLATIDSLKLSNDYRFDGTLNEIPDLGDARITLDDDAGTFKEKPLGESGNASYQCFF